MGPGSWPKAAASGMTIRVCFVRSDPLARQRTQPDVVDLGVVPAVQRQAPDAAHREARECRRARAPARFLAGAAADGEDWAVVDGHQRRLPRARPGERRGLYGEQMK